MTNYIVRRIASAIPTLLLVAIMVFMLIHMIPGNPAAVMLGSEATQEEIDALSTKMGFDKPLLEQFFTWITNVLKGDLGDSLYYNRPVTELLAERMEPTFLTVVFALLIATMVGVPLGIIAAVKRGKVIDKLCMLVSMIGISTPNFWLALNLIILLSVNLSVFPSSGYATVAEVGLLGTLSYLVLPSLALGLQRSASVARVTRSSVLEVLHNDYVRTARAKGLKESMVIVKHVLKNAMNQILTQVGISLAQLIGGAVVIETIFNIPGIGSLAYDSINRRDYPMIQAHILYVALVYIVVNLVVDLLYKVFDPRVSYN